MYSYKERKRAVEEYIRQDFNARATIRELGYPSRTALVQWYREFKEAGGLKKKRIIRQSAYRTEERQAAVEYYFVRGESMGKTIRELGLRVKRDAFRGWIREFAPERELNCKRQVPVVNCTQEEKEAAVAAFCSGAKTAQELAAELGVSRLSLYHWRNRFLSGKEGKGMPKAEEDLRQLREKYEETLKKLQQRNRELEEAERRLYRARMECDVLEKVAEVLKKEEGADPREMRNREKANVIGALRNKYPLRDLLEQLQMAKSSYEYQAASRRKPEKYAELREDLKAIFAEAKGRYGYRRLHEKLKAAGRTVSEKVIRRLMKEEGLAARGIKRRRYNSYMGEISPAVEDLLQRDFHADRPNMKWLTDITEFNIPAGKVYLSPIIDCFDGMAVSWTIGTSPNAALVNTMLDQAISKLGADEHPIVHSDRGGHYRWPGWIRRMQQAKLVRSMSRKGCSPDNAACEGFFGRLKNEMFYGHSWEGVSTAQFIRELDEYMNWYNEERIKLSLGARSPLAFRQHLHLFA